MKATTPSDERRIRHRQNKAVRSARGAAEITQQTDAAAAAPPAQEQDAAAAVAGPDDLNLFPESANAEPETVDETAVSEEEQAQYSQIIKQVASVVYKAPRDFVAAMSNPDEPIHVQVGRIAAQLGTAIEQKAEASGAKLGPDVMFHAGDEVVGILLDLAIQGGAIKLDPESEQYQKVHGMSMMEAEKAFGERMLADPKKAPMAVDEAGNMWAQQIAAEVEDGSADPAFMEAAQGIITKRSGQPGGVQEGVQRALRGGRGT